MSRISLGRDENIVRDDKKFLRLFSDGREATFINFPRLREILHIRFVSARDRGHWSNQVFYVLLFGNQPNEHSVIMIHPLMYACLVDHVVSLRAPFLRFFPLRKRYLMASLKFTQHAKLNLVQIEWCGRLLQSFFVSPVTYRIVVFLASRQRLLEGCFSEWVVQHYRKTKS